MAAGAQAGDQCVAVGARDRRLAGRIDVRRRSTVSASLKQVAELVEQRLARRV